MNTAVNVTAANMLAFLAVWYLFTITTYGTNVPAGLFLPGMIIGCCLGAAYSFTIKNMGLVHDDPDFFIDLTKNFIVLGCAGVMGGYTRMTYSLAVILMETSNTLNLFVPIIFTCIISNKVGYLFTRGLYERACRGKQMPILMDFVPQPCEKIVAE